MFEVPDPGEDRGDRLSANEILQRGAARIEADLDREPALQAALLMTLSEVHASLSEFERADVVIKRALVLAQQAQPPAPDLQIRGLRLAASMAFRHFRFDEAEALVAEALAQAGEPRRDTYAELAQLLTMRAGIASSAGDPYRAIELLAPATRMINEYGCPESPLCGSLLITRGLILAEADRLALARDAMSSARERLIRQYGKGYPRVGTSTGNLSDILVQLGDIDRARELAFDALPAVDRLHGRRSPPGAYIFNRLANLESAAGNFELAQVYFEESDHNYETSSQPRYIARAALWSDHGKFLLARGRAREALARFDLAVELRIEHARTADRGHAELLARRADALLALGRDAEALASAEEAATLRARLLPEWHPEREASERQLARLLGTMGRDDAAQPHLRAAEQVSALREQQETRLERDVLPLF